MSGNTIKKTTPGTDKKSPFITIIVLAMVATLILGLMMKNKKEVVPPSGAGQETKSTNGIPPDSLHH